MKKGMSCDYERPAIPTWHLASFGGQGYGKWKVAKGLVMVQPDSVSWVCLSIPLIFSAEARASKEFGYSHCWEDSGVTMAPAEGGQARHCHLKSQHPWPLGVMQAWEGYRPACFFMGLTGCLGVTTL